MYAPRPKEEVLVKARQLIADFTKSDHSLNEEQLTFLCQTLHVLPFEPRPEHKREEDVQRTSTQSVVLHCESQHNACALCV